MKRLSIIFGMLLLVIGVEAQLSELQISSVDQTVFNIIVDGHPLASNVNQVHITELQAGNHQLQISKQQYVSNPFGYQQLQHVNLFNGNITISPNTLIIAVLHQNQLMIQNQVVLAPVQNNYGHGSVYPPQYSSGNPNQSINPIYNGYGFPGYPTNNPPNNAPSCPNSGSNNPPQHYGPQAMSSHAFNQLKSSIDSQWFSSGQMDVFKQALRLNHFTSQQVNELVQMFTFSSDKLAVAKKAYTKTIDPQNYFVVNSSLEYSSSVNSLTAYIASL